MFSQTPIPVVNLPDPVPVDAYNGGSMPAIPDDIVREISNFLNFSDRLSLASTCQHMLAVVQLRLQEVVVEAHRLAALHKWIFEDPAVRGPHLRTLQFVEPPTSWSLFSPERYGPAIQYCLDILGQAPKLEELSCAPYLSLALDSKHLQALTDLRCLRLSGCTYEMLVSLRLPDTLTQIHLSDSLVGTVLPFRRILRTIYRLPALTTLVLERLLLPDDSEDDVVNDDDLDGSENGNSAAEETENEDGGEFDAAEEDAEEENGSEDGDGSDGPGGIQHDAALLIISSIRTLRTLEQEIPPWISLANTFPGLRTFVLDGSTHLNADVGDMGTLQHLLVSGSFHGKPVHWRVNHLTYVPGFTAHDSLVLDNACDPAHLVILTIQLVYVSHIVLDRVLGHAPNIYMLEIESLESPASEYISLFSNLFKPDAPINLPLMCLSIIAPASSTQAAGDKAEKRDIFLNRASLYLPSLRYVALAEAPESETLPCKDDYSGIAAPWRWWRVIRDEGYQPVEVREIAGWEGERVRRYLNDTDKEGAEHFDDHFNALR